ncbi:P-loop containing nucleoside triphosphate hydrolase protein [Lophiotrema nucula]|uniref:P-loop containing nucleoside triphosphate hydrolase protein n=1 Tax=Lophiotrema nucula TaxID=690887 RepID=A0A6A5YH27_9PLEO|nr:P-loop containing nucleoside triphosphate hydrolase protein [Lophiotrema nucula]
MPLIYGEGRVKAFERLQRELHGFPARIIGAKPARNVHWMVPRKVNSFFTGRSELVDRIRSAFRFDQATQTEEQKRFVITGIGGQGKSEVCLKVANLMREDFWGVFWVDIDRHSTAKNGFVTIAKALGSSGESIDDSLQALASTKRRWLLVLDNADDPDFDYAVYIPPGTRGAVIITSRIPECSQYSTRGSEALEGLDLQHSIQLLLKAAKVPEASWLSCERQAQDIVRLLGSHTLALIQAGAYIAGGFCRLDQYPRKYQQQRKRLLKHHPKHQQARYLHVYATFEASVAVLHNAVEETGNDALDLLAIMSVLHFSVFPFRAFGDAWTSARRVLQMKDTETSKIDALRQWHVFRLPELIGVQEEEWDDYRLKRASNLLASLSLVITSLRSDNLDGLSMHPLAHAWAKDRLEEEQQERAWVCAGCLLSLLRGHSETWQVYEKELRPHVQSYLSPATQVMFSYAPQKFILPVVLQCGWMLNDMREDVGLECLLQGIYGELQITPSQPSREHLRIWDLAARNLGCIGNSGQAAALLGHVVRVQETTLAETSPDRLASQHALASAYLDNGQTKEAVILLEHVVKIQMITLKETHPNRLASQHELARTYQANGQTREAIALLEYVVKTKETTPAESTLVETTLPEIHPSQLASQHILAGAYLDNGQTKEALVLLERVVKIRETTLAETHPS